MATTTLTTLPALPADLDRCVETALIEDVGAGDLTARLVDEKTEARAVVISREAAVLCGQPWFQRVYERIDPRVQVTWEVKESSTTRPDQRVAIVAGPARAVLTGERTALNFLQLLSATATATRRFVERVRGTPVQIVDTRKTVPGLRLLEKHAVRVGGGVNHRFGLDDGILIKNTHVALGGGTAAVVARVRAAAPAALRVQVECRSERELHDALAAGADAVLLDNRTPEEAAALIDSVAGRVPVELSGGITLANVARYAAAGADRISIGALTHSAPGVPIHLRIETSS